MGPDAGGRRGQCSGWFGRIGFADLGSKKGEAETFRPLLLHHRRDHIGGGLLANKWDLSRFMSHNRRKPFKNLELSLFVFYNIFLPLQAHIDYNRGKSFINNLSKQRQETRQCLFLSAHCAMTFMST